MLTPRRRSPLATGAFFFSVAALALGLSGCASFRNKKAAAAAPATLVAPRHVEIGRILGYEASGSTAVIEFVPQFHSPVPLAGTKLISRDLATLAPTARLIAAPYQNNRTLGAYVSSGAPGIDDEVVIDPESAVVASQPASVVPPKPTGRPPLVLPATPAAPKPRGGARR